MTQDKAQLQDLVKAATYVLTGTANIRSSGKTLFHVVNYESC
jgi:hypothetical protein